MLCAWIVSENSCRQKIGNPACRQTKSRTHQALPVFLSHRIPAQLDITPRRKKKKRILNIHPFHSSKPATTGVNPSRALMADRPGAALVGWGYFSGSLVSHEPPWWVELRVQCFDWYSRVPWFQSTVRVLPQMVASFTPRLSPQPPGKGEELPVQPKMGSSKMTVQ